MKLEPLKDKGQYCDGGSLSECNDPEKWYHLDEDIKSAVEWFKKELRRNDLVFELKEGFTDKVINFVELTIDEAFEDVMKR